VLFQVVSGTKFKAKLRVGQSEGLERSDDDYWHVHVVQPLPHTSEKAFVLQIQTGKTATDPLE